MPTLRCKRRPSRRHRHLLLNLRHDGQNHAAAGCRHRHTLRAHGLPDHDVFVLPTRVHERYLFPVFALLPILAYSPDEGVTGGVKLVDGDLTRAHLALDVLAIYAERRQQELDLVLAVPRLFEKIYARIKDKAAEGGNLRAAANVAMLYRNGEGVRHDRAIADKWAQYLAEQTAAAAK